MITAYVLSLNFLNQHIYFGISNALKASFLRSDVKTVDLGICFVYVTSYKWFIAKPMNGLQVALCQDAHTQYII